MPVGRTLFGGSPYLGVYLRVGETTALVPPGAYAPLEREVERTLGVRIVRSTVADSEVVGALLALNSNGVVVGDELDPEEERALSAFGRVSVVRQRQNAMGNNILANDHGAVVHPELSDSAVAAIAEALAVPVRRSTIAGLGTVGMAGIATNRGVVVHPKATDREALVLEEALGVPVHRSTANFGVPIVGACVVANSHGLLMGRPTTAVEVSHLQEGLQLFE
ncbi:MAG TPA: translation initiation factor IF-6 [Thermoplasmata archaeon]|nr:translation initiation factor IF-6 [Thermoplasmata archaeon]